MATVRKPSSLAARNMRIAISLRLAASSLRSGFVFFISETVKGPREILHCFMVTTRLSSSFSDFRELVIFLRRQDAPRDVCWPMEWLVPRALPVARNLRDDT